MKDMANEKLNFTVLHLAKKKKKDFKYISKLDKHIKRDISSIRTYKNNIDRERIHLNRDLLDEDSKYRDTDILEAIEERTKEGYSKKTAIRKDAVRCFTLHLSASHEICWDIYNNEEQREKWIEANKKWVYDTFKKENIVRFELHADEKTPHFHVIGVPIANDGSLSMKKFVDGCQSLKKLHDSYFQAMKSFGLRRGIEGGRNKATTVERFRGQVIEKQQEIIKQAQIEAKKKFLTSKKIDVFKEVLEAFAAENQRVKATASRIFRKVELLDSIVTRQKTLLTKKDESLESLQYEKQKTSDLLKKVVLGYNRSIVNAMSEAERIVFNDLMRRMAYNLSKSPNQTVKKEKKEVKKTDL